MSAIRSEMLGREKNTRILFVSSCWHVGNFEVRSFVYLYNLVCHYDTLYPQHTAPFFSVPMRRNACTSKVIVMPFVGK
jgi:hypothetical protein